MPGSGTTDVAPWNQTLKNWDESVMNASYRGILEFLFFRQVEYGRCDARRIVPNGPFRINRTCRGRTYPVGSRVDSSKTTFPLFCPCR